MAGIKWIKLATNMHDDEKIKLIDAMPERDTIHYVWIRILLLGGKLNADGEIFLSEGRPLTAKMLAILFSRSPEDIKISLKVLSNFGMIEITPDKVIRIVNWDKHQNIEGMERVREQNRKRAENHREKKKLEKVAAKGNNEGPYEDEVLEENIGLEENMALEEKEDLQKSKTLEEGELLDNGEKVSINIVNAEKTNTITNEAGSNYNVETADNNYNAGKNTSNITQNESNVTVTEQNKKEIENKKKSKIENKKEKKEIDNDINLKALELMKYHEKITGKVGGGDYVALRAAIDIHGEKRVRMAMEVGFERNCPDIKYAIGVLKNWRRDGYPKDHMEVKNNGFRCVGKSNTADKNEFAGFKPKEPRKLTETERKRIEANLI